MTKRVLRTEVPVDDQWHQIEVGQGIVHVVTRRPEVVEVWFLSDDTKPPLVRTMRVFGTGQDLPDEPLRYLGSAVTAGGSLVWHLFRKATVSDLVGGQAI